MPDTQKVILITGTSSGFGMLTAARLASRGHFVYATMRDLAKQQGLIAQLDKRNAQARIRALDVTKPNTIAAVIMEIEDRHDRIDVLINNAGYGMGGFFEDLEDGDIRDQMEVNFFGVQNVCRQVIPMMRKKAEGRIINISSVAGRNASPGLGAYAASKWALEAFSESLYHELSVFGIKVIIVEPGSYPTKIFTDNARYAKRFNDPTSPYYRTSQAIRSLIDFHVNRSTRDPEQIAALIERILSVSNPRLRYASDLSSWLEMTLRRALPPAWSNRIYRKLVHAHSSRTV